MLSPGFHANTYIKDAVVSSFLFLFFLIIKLDLLKTSAGIGSPMLYDGVSISVLLHCNKNVVFSKSTTPKQHSSNAGDWVDEKSLINCFECVSYICMYCIC